MFLLMVMFAFGESINPWFWQRIWVSMIEYSLSSSVYERLATFEEVVSQVTFSKRSFIVF